MRVTSLFPSKPTNSSFRPEAALFAAEVEKPASLPAPFKSLSRAFSTLLKHRFDLIAILAFAFLPALTHAQGCTQCRDNAAATSPQTRAAYRHAIILMTGTATGLFLTTLFIFKRQR